MSSDTSASTVSSDTKECPDCAEAVKAAARKCRFCGYEFAPTSPAPAPSPSPSLPLPVPVAPASAPAGVAVPERDVADLLSHLVDKNLVAYEEDEYGRGRYRLLETVRQYARDRLVEGGAAAARARHRHRDHFLAFAEEARPNLTGPEQARWLDRLESEHENLRAALDWCLDGDEEEGAEAGLRLAGALWLFWQTRGHLSEGREWYAAALSHPGAQEPTKPRAAALKRAGLLARMQSDYASASTLLEESLAIGRQLGDKQDVAASLSNLGLMASEQGDYASARALLEESLAIQREGVDRRGVAVALLNLGNVASSQGDTASARSLYEESLAIGRRLGDKEIVAILLANQGIVAGRQGDTASARTLYEESLAIHREAGNKHGTAVALVNLGPLACKERDYAASRGCLVECLTLCRALGEKRVTAYALEGFAALAGAREQPERSVRLHGASDALRSAIGVPLTPNEREEVGRNLASLRAALGDKAFEAAWAQGRALTWEQAIEHALEQDR